MKISKPMKVLVGILTGLELLWPFVLIAAWFFFMVVAINSTENQNAQADTIIPLVFFPFLCLMICSSFLTFGLKIFYLVHLILNKTGTDIARILFGVGIFFLSFITMPVYFFVYIWPEKPARWAVIQNTTDIPN
jgi:hypothetical protein